MPNKSERRMMRLESRVEALEKAIKALPVSGWVEEEPARSVFDGLYEKAKEIGVDLYAEPSPGPFKVSEEIREEGERPPAKVVEEVVVSDRDKAVPVKPTLSVEELERRAYELNEEGHDWKEVEEELGLKAPWLAAGRWRKKIERGEV